MTAGYKTVFEVSCFSNGTLFFSLFALLAGMFLFGVATVIYGRMGDRATETVRKNFFYFRLIVLVCTAVSMAWLVSNIYDACKLTHALRSGQCEVVEGTVQVLQRQPWGGRGANRIQIGDRQFSYSSHAEELGYHGGELLVDGVAARLHCLGNTILKVEIRQ